MQVIEGDPGIQLLAARVNDERLSVLGFRQANTAHDGRPGGLGNAIRLPVMVGVPVRDDDMGNGRPFLRGNQTPEIEYPEVLAGVYRNPRFTLLDQERVIQVVGDPHSTCFR